MSDEPLKIPLAPELEARLDALAYTTQRTPSVIAAEAIERYVTRETCIIDSIERALDDERAGRTTTHDSVMAAADTILAKAEKARG